MNICMALAGSIPFQTELDELREHYEEAAENVQLLTCITRHTSIC